MASRSADTPLLPLANEYLLAVHRIQPGDRLHRLISRLMDTYIDDLDDDRISELERHVDTFRLTHADGSRTD